MTITINATGNERKRLVNTISAWLGVSAHYCGAPTFNYEVDYFTIDKSGSLHFDDRADSEVIERLLEHLYNEGFDIVMSAEEDSADTEESYGICISMPKSEFTETNLENLQAIITESPLYQRTPRGNHGYKGFLPLVYGNSHSR